MKPTREELIATLMADAAPVARPGRIGHRLAGWLAAAAAIALLAIALDAPLHAARWHALVTAPAVLVQAVLGAAAIVALARGAFRLAIPSPHAPWKILRWPALLLGCWLAVAVLDVVHPALTPALLGKRAHCLVETLYAGLPGFFLGWIALTRLWPLHGAWSGALLGLACGALPALAMLFLCMYDPRHHLFFHLLPGLAPGLVGALLGRWLLRPR
jgi:hypothetical protein